MKRLFLIWVILFCTQVVNAQDITPMGKSMDRSTSFSSESMKENKAEGLDLDSLAFVNTSWEITELEKGAQAMYAQVPMFYSTQSICVVKYPMKKFKTEILNRPERQSGKLSEIAEDVNASFAVNAGYFNMKEMVSSVYFREGRQQMGYTHPTELYRVNGLVGFKDRKGKCAKMEMVTDTTKYGLVSRGWYSAMASGPMLIFNGEIVVPLLTGDKIDTANDTGYSSSQFYDKRHPRTVFGWDNEGNAYLVAIDGRFRGRADGASIYETAYICHLLGMTNAINLDGGGSTTLWTRRTGIINHPSDNRKFDHQGERPIPNMIIVK